MKEEEEEAAVHGIYTKSVEDRERAMGA